MALQILIVNKIMTQYKTSRINDLTYSRWVYYIFSGPRVGLFSVKIQKTFLAIKNFSVNETMTGQPNKRLIHWHFEN